MKRKFLWIIWDTAEKDYALDNKMEVKIFKDKQYAERLAHCWNWNVPNRYKVKKIYINL